MKRFRELIAVTGMWGATFIMLLTMIFSYLQGGKVLIVTNEYGECLPEIVMLIVVLILGLPLMVRTYDEVFG